ncbi:hypothetical protein IMZ11_04085 [Microtetraspora sp. AC03309]|uniref:hypothetical protein n=1 Tax=Microtetraspora sp. AC03309 TaxID=2779376 RepID=UPI001E658E30|nr:hypothetical protein [Microtetraspora sp. AC03309]MCC5574815.1 hypothetical protein [Microtetraspora sp. AC03309]
MIGRIGQALAQRAAEAAEPATAAPGTVHRSVRPRAPARRRSSHALGLADAIAFGEALDRLPDELLVFGIEGGDFGLDAPVTPSVRAAIHETAEAIRRRLG